MRHDFTDAVAYLNKNWINKLTMPKPPATKSRTTNTVPQDALADEMKER
jgi:hypothetical protein